MAVETAEQKQLRELAAQMSVMAAKLEKYESRPDPITGKRPQMIPDQGRLLRGLKLDEENLPKEGATYCFPLKKGRGLVKLETEKGSVTQFPKLLRVNTVTDPRKEINDGIALIPKNYCFAFVRNYYNGELGDVEWSPNQNDAPIVKWKEWLDQGIRLYEPGEEVIDKEPNK